MNWYLSLLLVSCMFQHGHRTEYTVWATEAASWRLDARRRQIAYLNTVAENTLPLQVLESNSHIWNLLWQTGRQAHSWMSEDPRVTMEGRGGHRSGVPFLLQPFQLSPGTLVTIYEHDLPTLQLPHSAPGANLSSTPQLHQTNPQYPPDPRPATHTPSWQDKPNVTHAKLYMYYVYTHTGHTHTLTHLIRSPVFTLRGQWLFFSTGSKVTNKKIQYSKCTGSPAYQYIIQKGDRWQAIRRWKTIEFSVSPYLAISGCINLQLLIIELRRRRD